MLEIIAAFPRQARRKEMSTICHCNKEKKRNTHLRVKEASWNIAPLLSYLNSVESPPLSGVSFWRPDLASWRLNLAFFLHMWESPELVASPQLTALHSTGNTSAEDSVYKNEVGHNSTRGIVSPLLFFPLNYCCTKSTFPTSYVDWGYEFKTSIVKRSLR